MGGAAHVLGAGCWVLGAACCGGLVGDWAGETRGRARTAPRMQNHTQTLQRAGKFIFVQYPFVARAMAPLGPLAALYNGFPFLP